MYIVRVRIEIEMQIMQNLDTLILPHYSYSYYYSYILGYSLLLLTTYYPFFTYY